MTFGNPFGGGFGAAALDPNSWSDAGPDMNPDLRARILAMLSQQPQEGEVPDAVPPGFSGFNPPDALTNTMAPRLGDPNAPVPSLAHIPASQDVPLPLSMSGAAPRGMPAEPQGPLLNGTLDAPAPQMPGPGPQTTGPANSASAPDASPLARLPTLLDMKPPQMPPQMPANGNNGRPAGIPPTATPASPAAGAQPDAGDGKDTPPNAGLGSPKPPTAYTGLPPEKPTAPPAAIPGAPAPAVSAPPAGSLLAGGSGSTSAPGQPSRPANVAPAVAEPSIWKRLADAGIGDQMIAFGAGIAGGKNWGEGLQAGFNNVNQVGAQRAATQLAQTKDQMERFKLQREINAQNQTAAIIAQRMNVPIENAIALAANPQFVQNFLQSQFGAQDGRIRTATGMEVIPGSKEDPNVIAQTKRAELEPVDYAAAKAGAVTKATTENSGDTIETTQVPGVGLVAVNKDKVLSEDPAEAASAYRVIAPGQQPRPLTPSELQAYGIAKGTPVKMTASGPEAIGGGSVNIVNQQESAEASGLGKGRADEKLSYMQAGKDATNRLGLANRMIAGLDTAGDNITTGPGAESVLGIKRFVSSIIGHELPGTSATEVFANAGPTLAGEAAKAITSKPAIVEFQAMQASKPGLANTLEGNRAMLDLIRQGAEHDIAIARIARNAKVGEDIGAQVEQYHADHPYINPFTKQPMDGRGVQQGAAPQASSGTDTPAMGPLDKARAAIAAGADPNMVKTRLLRNGINPQGL